VYGARRTDYGSKEDEKKEGNDIYVEGAAASSISDNWKEEFS
jgi:hypothetical protein